MADEADVGLESNRVVKKQIPRLDKDIVPLKTQKHKPKKYTPMRMRNAINKYFEHCEKKDEVPSIKGMMIHLKLYKDAFYRYMEYPEFKDIMEHARLIISNWFENEMWNSKGLSAGKIAYMKNVHGWTEKIGDEGRQDRRLSVEEAKAIIEMMAPKLLEVLGQKSLLEQIPVDAEIIEETAERRV